jgi:hypothetical protein
MSSVGDVVAQLRAVVERLDRTAIAASRAQTDLIAGCASLTRAGQGSDHPKIRLAVTESDTAGAKAGKISRLLAEAAGHFTRYIDIIAPGAAPSGNIATYSGPSGEELMRDAAKRASIFRKASRAATHNAEQVGDYAKSFADFIDAARPKGTTSQVQRPEAPPTNPPSAPGETAQALAVTAAVLIAGALHLIDRFKQKRKESRDGSQSTPRPDSPDGEG